MSHQRDTINPSRSFSDYIVFVDESGDHSLASVRTDYPVFVLALCILPVDVYVNRITPRIRQLKFQLFGHDLVILHEHDIRKRTGPFAQLGKEARDALVLGLTEIIDSMPITLVAVVIDKVRYRAIGTDLEHPYHLALQHGLESVHQFLQAQGQDMQQTTIICEARGYREDRQIELAFRNAIQDANPSLQRYAMDIVIADKRTNSEGLQLADLMARPVGLHVLRPQQPNRAWDVLASKIFTNDSGAVQATGLKILP